MITMHPLDRLLHRYCKVARWLAETLFILQLQSPQKEIARLPCIAETKSGASYPNSHRTNPSTNLLYVHNLYLLSQMLLVNNRNITR